MKNNRGYIEGELVFIIALILICFIVTIVPVVAVVAGLGFPDSGEHVGYVTAVERGGFSNDYTAYVKTELESSQEDKYCVQDESVVERLREKAQSKTNVVIEYSRGWFEPITVCNGEPTVIINVRNK